MPPDGTGSGSDNDEWWNDAGRYASTFNNISIATGFIAASLGLFSLAFPPLAPFAAAFGLISLATGGLSAVFTGIEHGLDSGEFAASATGAALALLTFGQSKWIGAVTNDVVSPVTQKITQFGADLVSPVTGLLGSVFG